MEQTLGKRIVACRKAIGMTQDQLAERLGVTPQAVSKWENDQSCPDITTLPKLAEIFGTTTDALLGVVREEPAKEAAAEPIPEPETTGRAWTRHTDRSKKAGITFAIGVLLVGGLYLFASLMKLEVGLWDIIWPTAVLVFGVSGLFPYRRYSFLRLGCILLGGFFLINCLLPSPIRLDNGVVIACIILLAGVGLLIDAIMKPKKNRFTYTINGLDSDSSDRTPRCDYSIADGKLRLDAAFGDGNQRIVTPLLRSGMINTSFGDYEIDLSGVEEVSPNCRIEVNVSFGALTLWVPSRYQIQVSKSAAFADIEITGKPDPVPAGTIQLITNASFGDITIEYI